jgi:C_GCAxxG_C_C family probable redox protein
MTTKQESAIEAFRSEYNCAQVTLMAFANEVGLDLETAKRVSAGFGAGMGRLQETCGTVTGAFMVFGLFNSKYIQDNDERKTVTYEMIQEFSEKFKSIHGSITCKNLLNINLNTEEGMEEAREKDLFVNVCEKCILTSINLIEEQID